MDPLLGPYELLEEDFDSLSELELLLVLLLQLLLEGDLLALLREGFCLAFFLGLPRSRFSLE